MLYRPFIGTLCSVFLLGEPLPPSYLVAAVLMLVGMAFLYWEQHNHLHIHVATAHRHRHDHDEHHQHEHSADKAEPDHYHEHRSLTHLHSHWPDIHHRHSHEVQDECSRSREDA